MTSSSLVCIISQDLLVEEANDAFVSNFGPLDKTNFLSLVLESEQNAIQIILKDSLQLKKETTFECRMRGISRGERTIYRISWNTFASTNRMVLMGHFIMHPLLGILSEVEFTQLVNQIPSFMCCIDTSGNILWANESILLYLGYSNDEFVGKHISTFFVENSQEVQLLEKLRGEDSSLEHRCKIRNKDGELKPVQIRFSVDDDGQFAWCVMEDLTAVIENELELTKQVKLRLEAEINAKDKNTFIAKMSHELRTPLNGIIGIAEELLSLDLNEKSRNLAQTILDTATSLRVIVGDLLDISKIQATQLHIQNEPFNLAESIERTISLFSRPANEKGVKLELFLPPDLPKIFVGDSVRISQVLSNLLSNSLKFTNEGHVTVTVRCKYIGIYHCNVTVIVEDSGSGIPHADSERIFSEFYSSPESLKHGGTGLGLLLSKQLITLMGGSIHFKSELGKGSQFWFSLPLEEKPQKVEVPSRLGLLGYFRGKILVVDDSPVNLKVMEHYLKQAGCIVETAINGEEAVEMVQKNSYDIVFMDVQMPVKDGLTATREIRMGNKAIIIVGTSAGVESERVACFEAGMNAYLTKPIDKGELNKLLQVHCRKRSAQGDLDRTAC